MKRQFAILMVIGLFASLAFAHGNEQHLMGVVKNISKGSITVQTTNNQIQEVTITDKTTFENAGTPSKMDDLKVGDRVVIHAVKSGDKLVAHTVHFGARKAVAVQSR